MGMGPPLVIRFFHYVLHSTWNDLVLVPRNIWLILHLPRYGRFLLQWFLRISSFPTCNLLSYAMKSKSRSHAAISERFLDFNLKLGFPWWLNHHHCELHYIVWSTCILTSYSLLEEWKTSDIPRLLVVIWRIRNQLMIM